MDAPKERYKKKLILPIVILGASLIASIISIAVPAWAVVNIINAIKPNDSCQIAITGSEPSEISAAIYDPTFCNGSDTCAAFCRAVLIIAIVGVGMLFIAVLIGVIQILRFRSRFGSLFLFFGVVGTIVSMLGIIVWLIFTTYFATMTYFDFTCSSWGFYVFAFSTATSMLVIFIFETPLFTCCFTSMAVSEQPSELPTTSQRQVAIKKQPSAGSQLTPSSNQQRTPPSNQQRTPQTGYKPYKPRGR